MTTYRKSLYTILALTTAFMIIVSGVMPALSVLTKAADVLENQSGQQIGRYELNLISGAENLGTPQEPDYVWTPSIPNKGHRFAFQIDYALSGEGTLPSRSVQITVPKHILKDRTGSYADICDIAVPEERQVPEDDKTNLFVYTERENDYYIYNRIDISAAEMGTIQFAYDTSKTTFEYRDMEEQDTGSVTMTVNANGETVSNTTPMPHIKIDTSAEVSSSVLGFYDFYDSW